MIPFFKQSLIQEDELIKRLFSIIQIQQETIKEHQGIIKEQAERINVLEEEVKGLKAKLNQNSHNSHKPPSSDNKWAKPQTKSSNEERKSGGQIGHVGSSLPIRKHPDKIIEHNVDTCSHCRTDIREVTPLGWKVAQVFDIPLLRVEVTEHRMMEKWCPKCKKCSVANLENGLNFGTQYGSGIQALLVYLHHYHLIPSKRIVEFFQDICGYTLSEGQIFTASQACFNKLKAFEEELKKQLEEELVLHADETGLNIGGKSKWLHVLSCKRMTYYFAHPKRGKEATDAMQVLLKFIHTLIHDHWKSYFRYSCKHALCNAHHLRELKAVEEGTAHKWAKHMQDLLRQIKRVKDEGKLEPGNIALFESKYDETINLGYVESSQIHTTGPPPKRKSYPKEVCLLDRLKKYKRQVLAFMYSSSR